MLRRIAAGGSVKGWWGTIPVVGRSPPASAAAHDRIVRTRRPAFLLDGDVNRASQGEPFAPPTPCAFAIGTRGHFPRRVYRRSAGALAGQVRCQNQGLQPKLIALQFISMSAAERSRRWGGCLWFLALRLGLVNRGYSEDLPAVEQRSRREWRWHPAPDERVGAHIGDETGGPRDVELRHSCCATSHGLLRRNPQFSGGFLLQRSKS